MGNPLIFSAPLIWNKPAKKHSLIRSGKQLIEESKWPTDLTKYGIKKSTNNIKNESIQELDEDNDNVAGAIRPLSKIIKVLTNSVELPVFKKITLSRWLLGVVATHQRCLK